METKLGPEQDDQLAMFQAIRSVCAIFGADDPDGYHLLDGYRAPASDESMGYRMRVGQSALMWAYECATAEEAGTLAASAIQSDPSVLAEHTLIAVAPLYVLALADRDECMQIWEDARTESHRSGSVILHVTIDMWLGIIQHRRGDLTSAISGLRDALVFADRWGTGEEARGTRTRRSRWPTWTPGSSPSRASCSWRRSRRPGRRRSPPSSGSTRRRGCWWPRAASRTRSTPPA